MHAPIASATDDREYAIPDVNFYTTFSPRHNFCSPRLMRASTTNTGMPHCCVYQPPPILIPPVQDAPSIEATCGNSLMMTLMENQPGLINDLNADDLVLVKKIGDGSFGNIQLAELQVIISENKIEKQFVIVKSLNETVDDNQRYVTTQG